MESALKRLRVDEGEKQKLSWRGEPKFADWTLTRGDDVNIRVHKAMLVEGPRPMHFFKGATDAAYVSNSTDLSKLLPAGCLGVLEQALDFVYENKFHGQGAELPWLYKLADVLQCPSLQNAAIDAMVQTAQSTENSQVLFDAALESGQVDLTTELISMVPPDALANSAPKIARSDARLIEECIRQLALKSPQCSWIKTQNLNIMGSSVTLSHHHSGERPITAFAVSSTNSSKFVARKIAKTQEWFSDSFMFGLVHADVLTELRCVLAIHAAHANDCVVSSPTVILLDPKLGNISNARKEVGSLILDVRVQGSEAILAQHEEQDPPSDRILRRCLLPPTFVASQWHVFVKLTRPWIEIQHA